MRTNGRYADLAAGNGRTTYHSSLLRLDGAIVLTVDGEVDLAVEDQFRELLTAALAEASTLLVVDVGAVFLDVRGITALLELAHRGRDRKVRVAVASPRPVLRKVLAVLGVGDQLACYRSVAEALADSTDAS